MIHSAANVHDTRLFPHLLLLAQAVRAAIGRLYADARARGKRTPHATRIVARAWLRVIWA